MSRKLPALLAVIGLIVSIGLTTISFAEEKEEKKPTNTTGMPVRPEVVNTHLKQHSHVMVKPDRSNTFTTAATVTVSYKFKNAGGAAQTITYSGKVLKVQSDKSLIIRLTCATTPKKEKVKDSTSGTLTVTVSQGCMNDVTTIMDVVGDDEDLGCP